MGNQQLIRIVVSLLIALPIVPLGLSWYRLLRPSAGGATRFEHVVLLLATFSQTFLIVGLFSAAVLGSDYSDRRYATIFINLLPMLALTVAVVIAGRRLRWPLLVACAWITCSWGYVLAVSSVV
jgi:hypothetical protein